MIGARAPGLQSRLRACGPRSRPPPTGRCRCEVCGFQRRFGLVTLNQALLGIQKLGFDTPPFIYLIERHPAYLQVVRDIFARLDAGYLTGYSSVITLIEVLSQPKRTGNIAVERAYSDFLINSTHLSLLRVDEAIADRAADLRARYNLRTPDAIQLATAIHAGCQAFLTNDLALRRVTDLRVLVLSTLTL